MTAQDKLAKESNNKETSDSLPEEFNKETSDSLPEGTTAERTKNACSDDDTITKKSSPDVDYENKIISNGNKGALNGCFVLENTEKAPHTTENPPEKAPHHQNGTKNSDESPAAEDAGKKVRPKFNFFNEIKINKKLLPIKLAMFCFHGGSFCFLPYITLHMKQLGITNEEIAYIYAILPIPSILGPILSGVLADKLNAFKKVFLMNLILCIIFHSSLLWVPTAPSGLGVELQCDAGGAQLRWTREISPHPSTPLSYQDYGISLKNCRSTCVKIPLSQQFCFKSGERSECNITDFDKELELSAHVSLSEDWMSLIELDESSNSFAAKSIRPTLHNITYSGVAYDSLMCGGNCTCPQGCTVHCDTEKLVDNFKPLDSQIKKTFGMYLALRIPAQFFLASAFCMMDAVTMAVIGNEGGDFGKQRLMSMISLGTMPLLSGYLVDYLSTGGSPDYAIAFYVGDCLLLVSIAVTMLMNLGRPEGSSSSVLRDLPRLFAKPEVIVFMFAIVVLGSNWGFLENFFFVYLKELNASTSLMGWTLTFGCVIGVPAMFASDRIIEKVGRSNIFILSFVAYSIRMFGYSFITNPWYAFPFEGLEIITYQLMWVAAVTYYAIIVPPSLLATMSGAAGTIHYNGGRGIGAFAGGKLIHSFGARNTFRIFGVASLVGGVVYVLLRFFWLRGRNKSEDEDGSDSQKKVEDIGNDKTGIMC